MCIDGSLHRGLLSDVLACLAVIIVMVVSRMLLSTGFSFVLVCPYSLPRQYDIETIVWKHATYFVRGVPQ
jgi:hypothetical protein